MIERIDLFIESHFWAEVVYYLACFAVAAAVINALLDFLANWEGDDDGDL